jgi:predicted nucleic acid-binding protein
VNLLVDTSIWSLALRRKAHELNPVERAAVAELTNLVKEGRARIIGLVRQELLSGIKTAGQYEKLRAVLRSFPDEPVSTADYEAAAKAGNECRARGVAVSVSDMLICAVAMARDWSIFAADPDFNSYARILPLKLHTARK